MAFGDALRPTDGATIRLVAETGEFNSRIEAAERQWRESTGQMSREALKLDLAQDRLRKSLASYGAESAQAKRATIALKDAEEANARAADKLTRETQQLDRATRSTATGMQRLRTFALQLGAAVGLYGLAAGIRSAVEAAKEQELVLGQTRIAVQAVGIQYERYREQIEAVIRAQSQLGFDDEALMRTFQLFIRSTRDVGKALALNALAADVARGRYIDLEQAAQIVNKANLGMSGALRRIGIDVEKNATRQELLNRLTESYGRAAEEASDTATAASARLSVEWENMKEIVGMGLLPAVTTLADRFADYFGDAENQRRVQEKVNEAIETGEEVIRGFAGGLRIAKDAAAPLVDAMGGIENAVRTVTLLWVGFKVKALLGFAGTALASRTTAARMVADATMAGRAWDIATRPRALVVTGGGVPVPGGGGVPAPGRGGRPPLPGTQGPRGGGLVGFAGIAAAAIILGQVGTPPSLREQQRLVFDTAHADRAAARRLARDFNREFGTPLRALLDNNPFLIKYGPRLYSTPTAAEAEAIAAPGEGRLGGPGAQGGSGTSGRRAGGRPTEADLLLNLARPGNERADLDALRSFYARQIRALEARKNLTKEQKEKLRGLYGDIAGIQSQIDAIEDEARAKEEERQQKQEEKRRKQLEREQRAREREAERLRRGDTLGAAHRPETMLRGRALSQRHAQQQRELREMRKANRDAERTYTLAEVRAMQAQFLTEWQGAGERYGSNITADGAQTATNTWTTARLMMEQNHLLDRLTRGVQHPGAKYARTELSYAYGGVGGL